MGRRSANYPPELRERAVGDAYDNALAESVIGLFKTELIKPRGPRRTAEQVEIATMDYVDWFNHRRLYEACGDIPGTRQSHELGLWPAVP